MDVKALGAISAAAPKNTLEPATAKKNAAQAAQPDAQAASTGEALQAKTATRPRKMDQHQETVANRTAAEAPATGLSLPEQRTGVTLDATS